MTAQEQAIRTKYIRKVIDKEDIDPKCRMCGERDETVAHILAGCKMLAQCQYKNWRHDKVAQALHWEICKKYGLPASEKWYDHRIETVMENEEVTVMWDMKIQTDKEIEHCRPDIVIRCNKSRKCYIVDVACPFDTRVQDKEREKVEKYQDLKRELKRIWQSQEIVTIPIIIGTLGTVSKNVEHWLRKLDIMVNFSTLQKACLLESARVIRKVLDT